MSESSNQERYSQLSDAKAGYIAMANELLKLEEDRRLNYVDIIVSEPAAQVLARLEETRLGSELLAGGGEQLAIESDGSYYPILNVTKEQSQLAGAGARVWDWMDAESTHRRLEVALIYGHEEAGRFNEVISVDVFNSRRATACGELEFSAYAETGYNGHREKLLYDVTDEDIAEFSDFFVQIVGDNPESIAMRQDRILQDITEGAVTPEAKSAIHRLIDEKWPAQALGVMRRQYGDTSIAQMLVDPERVDCAIDAIEEYLSKKSL